MRDDGGIGWFEFWRHVWCVTILRLLSHHQRFSTYVHRSQKPRLDGLALAFQNPRSGQSCHEAVNLAQLGLAYLGLAWLGSRPQAGPGTALWNTISHSITYSIYSYDITSVFYHHWVSSLFYSSFSFWLSCHCKIYYQYTRGWQNANAKLWVRHQGLKKRVPC